MWDLVDYPSSIKLNIIKLLNSLIYYSQNKMNATELEAIRQQSDGPTLIMMFIMMCIFGVGGYLLDD